MGIFIETLFNILTKAKETVYTFFDAALILGWPAKPRNGVLDRVEYRCQLKQADMQSYVKAVFGSGYVVAGVEKMHGGTQKSVYKIECANGFVCALYVWDLSSNYFQQEIESEKESERSFGGECFELNNRHLTERGIRTPALYAMNKERDAYPFDFAWVEYVSGPTAKEYLNAAPKLKDQVFVRLGEMLVKMHADERSAFGKLSNTGETAAATGECHAGILENARKQLSFLSRYVDEISIRQSRLFDVLYELEARIAPRKRYGFIHGELGPDHVLIGENLEPYLIDIEGAGFFDIEHEHSFLEFRFGEAYRYLKQDTLGPDRMRFYKFHHHISCASGGLKLLQRGFPDQKLAKDIADYNVRSALRFLEEGDRK